MFVIILKYGEIMRRSTLLLLKNSVAGTKSALGIEELYFIFILVQVSQSTYAMYSFQRRLDSEDVVSLSSLYLVGGGLKRVACPAKCPANERRKEVSYGSPYYSLVTTTRLD